MYVCMVFGMAWHGMLWYGIVRHACMYVSVCSFVCTDCCTYCLLYYPRGSIYTTIMELGPQNHNGDGLLGPNSIIVVYMDPLGTVAP